MNKNNSFIVETIPIGMESLKKKKGVLYTTYILTNLINKAQKSINLTAMYWTLKPNLKRFDEQGLTKKQLNKMWFQWGVALFIALENAAKRGVKIRILQASGSVENEYNQESKELADYGSNVEVREIDLNRWYDNGIMHQKLWIFDNKDIYLGSANMDWRSLTQVKELGILLEDQPVFSEDVTAYFESWWFAASIKNPKVEKINDQTYGLNRTIPSWSKLVPEENRSPFPLDNKKYWGHYNMDNPLSIVINNQKADVFITGCPIEFCAPGRTFDCEAIVQTIQSAKRSISICIMDFVPISIYRRDPDHGINKGATAWWPVIFNSLMQAIITNGVNVRLMVSKWEHTHPTMPHFLQSFKEMSSIGGLKNNSRCGTLEIRYFCVPGWEQTGTPHRLYPGHSRVNHAKYIVTDNRINIGTSNFTWDYFTSSAGTSFNCNHQGLIKKLQEIFDRDWESQYTSPL
jgi:phospholipase D3/4